MTTTTTTTETTSLWMYIPYYRHTTTSIAHDSIKSFRSFGDGFFCVDFGSNHVREHTLMDLGKALHGAYVGNLNDDEDYTPLDVYFASNPASLVMDDALRADMTRPIGPINGIGPTKNKKEDEADMAMNLSRFVRRHFLIPCSPPETNEYGMLDIILQMREKQRLKEKLWRGIEEEYTSLRREWVESHHFPHGKGRIGKAAYGRLLDRYERQFDARILHQGN